MQLKKIIAVIIIIILLITITCSIFILPSKEVKVIEDVISIQNKIDDNINIYTNTFDNPNVIIDPYGISPLTALITFKTEDLVKIKVVIKGKDNSSDIIYSENNESNAHIIPIYGLYPNYENTVILSTPSKTKELTIKTNDIDINLVSTFSVDKPNQLNLISMEHGVVGLDQNNEIRFYLKGNYTHDIVIDDDNNLILSTNRYDNNGNNTGIVKMNLLGKILCEYNLKDGYKGLIDEIDKTKIILLSKNVIEYDIQTGYIYNEYDISEFDDNWLDLIYTGSEIILVGTKYDLYFDYKTKKLSKLVSTETVDSKFSTILVDLPKINTATIFQDNLYTYTRGDTQITSQEKIYDIKDLVINELFFYKLSKGIYISSYNKTIESKKYISTLLYKENDTDVKVYKEYDRLVIEGNFKSDDEVYIILDKLFDKHIYKFDSNKKVFYINSYGLKGQYSIYIKVNNKIMKTDKYVNF